MKRTIEIRRSDTGKVIEKIDPERKFLDEYIQGYNEGAKVKARTTIRISGAQIAIVAIALVALLRVFVFPPTPTPPALSPEQFAKAVESRNEMLRQIAGGRNKHWVGTLGHPLLTKEDNEQILRDLYGGPPMSNEDVAELIAKIKKEGGGLRRQMKPKFRPLESDPGTVPIPGAQSRRVEDNPH